MVSNIEPNMSQQDVLAFHEESSITSTEAGMWFKFPDILWHTPSQAKDKVSVSVEDAERLKVTMADFDHAIQFDVKPAFGISDEQLENYVFKGRQLGSVMSCDSHVTVMCSTDSHDVRVLVM